MRKPKQQKLVEISATDSFETKDVSLTLRDFPVIYERALAKLAKHYRRPKGNQVAVYLEESIKRECKKLNIKIGG